MTTKRKKPLTDSQLADSARLRELFESRVEVSQLEFGQTFGIGNQGMVWQYLNADKPKGSALNVTAATKFARGVKCRVADFSPTLQEEIDQLAQFATQSNVLPLPPASAIQREVLAWMDEMSERGRHELALLAEKTQERHPRKQSKQRT